MSSFDDALRRVQAQDSTAAAARDAVGARQAQWADAAAASVTQMVQDFARNLYGKVRPTRVRAGSTWKKGIFSAGKSVDILSPDGYAVYRGGNPGNEHRVVVITTDGRLWQSKKINKDGWVHYIADYLPITGKALLDGQIWIGTRVDLKDGRPCITYPESPPDPLEDVMARMATQFLRLGRA